MKVFALSLLLFGLAAASSEWSWETGKEYIYKYSGRMLTGFPELAEHYSGLAINCTVHVQAREADTLWLTISDAKYVKVNEKLEPSTHSIDGMDGYNWRELLLPELTPVSGEYSSILAMPIIIKMKRGEIREIQISRDEPLWSVNFKKALAIKFQTKLDTSSVSLEDNKIGGSEGETYWKVKEETLDGVCESIYQVNELPHYMIKDRPELIPYPEACTSEKYYGITKTRNHDNCEKWSRFNYFRPGRYGIETTGNFKDSWARTTETRYIACGSRGQLVIQTIFSNGELSQNLLKIKSERMVTGTMQVLRLKEVRPVSTSPETTPGDLVTLKSLMYEYTYESFRQGTVQTLQEETENSLKPGRVPWELMKNSRVVSEALPRSYLSGLSPEEMKTETSPERIVPQIKELIKEIVGDLVADGEQKLSEKHVGMKVLSVARGMGLLPTEESIMSVYSQLSGEFSGEEDKYTMTNIFVDSVMMGGTPACIRALKELITSGTLTTSQITNVFMWLPQYVLAPTPETLSTLFELIQSEKVTETPIVYSSAILGFSTLLQKSCIGMYRRASNPVYVFGELCHPDSEIVVQKWIPYLAHQLKSTHSPSKKNEILLSLGMMTHKSIIPYLLPYLEGSAEGGATPLNRFMAMTAVSVIGSENPVIVMPMVMSILANPSESTDLRVTAFHTLLRLNPPTAVLQRVVALTWRTHDHELLKTINTAFYSLSVSGDHQRWERIAPALAKKVAMLYPLIKKVSGILPSSATLFTSDYLGEMKVGYNQILSYLAGNTTVLPKKMYSELMLFMDNFNFSPVSLAARFDASEGLVSEIRKYLWSVWTDGQQVSSELKKVLEQLKLKSHEGGPMDGAFFLRLFESTPFLVNFDKISLSEMKELIKPYLRDPEHFMQKMCGKFPLNFQRTMDVMPSQMTVPSEMGFPINMELHMPIMVSLRGQLDIDCRLTTPSVQFSGKSLFNALYTGYVGTICPFTKEYILTGIEDRTAVFLPADISLKVDVPAHKVSISVKPTTSSGTVELFNLKVLPFTVSKKIADIKPLIAGHFKKIASNEPERQKQYPVAEFLGLNLFNHLTTESPFRDYKYCRDVYKLFNNNPLNRYRFFFLFPTINTDGRMSMRNHEYSLEMRPSPTREIQMDFKLGFGTKTLQGLKYHTVQWNSKQNQQYQAEERHPGRQQKIQKILQQVEEGQAVTVTFTMSVMGSRPHTMTYQLSAFRGSDSHSGHGLLKQKWNVMLESDSEISRYLPFKQMCVKGELDVPLMPIWSMKQIQSSLAHFSFKNLIGFGSGSCEESTVMITGTAKTSSEQREYSSQSKEANKCRNTIQKAIDGGELSNVCELARLQAKTVDEVEFRVTYKNMPDQFHFLETRYIQAMKTLWWPLVSYYKSGSSGEVRETREVLCQIKFHRTTPSFDLRIQRNEEKLVFQNVRVWYPLSVVFPLKAGVSNTDLAVKSITGYTSMPACKISSEQMITFNNRTLPFHMSDDCFHLMTGDCSSEHKSGILMRSLKSGNRRQMKVLLGDAVILLTPGENNSYQPYSSELKVTVEGEEMHVPVNSWKPLMSGGTEYGSIFRSSDNVMHLKAPKYYTEFLFDGVKATIFGSSFMKNQLCGLCGNYNHNLKKSVNGVQMCSFSSPQAEVASFVVPSPHCRMSHELQQKVQKGKCAKFQVLPTKVSKSLQNQVGKSCLVTRHMVLERSGNMCLSKVPITECSPICKVSPGQLSAKKVAFTCLPEGRVADVYVQKAYDGQELPELGSLDTTFETEVEMPKRCIPLNPRI